MRLRLSPTASRRARSSSFGATAASVVKKASIVARLGAIMPAPLAIPPTRQVVPPTVKSTLVCFGFVSVVMMARAASGPPSRDSRGAASAMPARSFGIGSRTPITPVEATTTCSTGQPTACAVSAAISLASARPASPVAALAQPAFATIARVRPPARCSRETRTGAACARLVVKTPADTHGPSATTSARSSRSGLMPDATPAARKPSGAVTLTSPAGACWPSPRPAPAGSPRPLSRRP